MEGGSEGERDGEMGREWERGERKTARTKSLLRVRFVVVLTTLNIAWKIPSKLLFIIAFPNRPFNNNPQNFNNQSNLEGLVSNFMASQDARLSKFEADFKHQQSEMTNKIDTFLKAINDRMTGALPSDTVKNPKMNVNPTLWFRLLVLIRWKTPKAHLVPSICSRLEDSKLFDTLADLGSCMNLIPLYLFKKLKIGLLEETDRVFGLADGTKSYPKEIVKNVEVHIGKLKLLEDFYVKDMEKDPATPLLVGRGFLTTVSAVVDCKKAKIEVGEGVTRLIFGVKEIDLGDEKVPYWTTLRKRESYEPQPSTNDDEDNEDGCVGQFLKGGVWPQVKVVVVGVVLVESGFWWLAVGGGVDFGEKVGFSGGFVRWWGPLVVVSCFV
nr:hypothetical protein [Tanacetum cinerariifolium]